MWKRALTFESPMLFRSYRYSEPANADDPLVVRQLAQVGHQLPAARAQLNEPPKIQSERPAFEPHYPHVVEHFREESQQHPKKRRAYPSAPFEVGAAATHDEPASNGDPTEQVKTGIAPQWLDHSGLSGGGYHRRGADRRGSPSDAT